MTSEETARDEDHDGGIDREWRYTVHPAKKNSLGGRTYETRHDAIAEVAILNREKDYEWTVSPKRLIPSGGQDD